MTKPACGSGCGCERCIWRVQLDVQRALAELPPDARPVALDAAIAACLDDLAQAAGEGCGA